MERLSVEIFFRPYLFANHRYVSIVTWQNTKNDVEFVLSFFFCVCFAVEIQHSWTKRTPNILERNVLAVQ